MSELIAIAGLIMGILSIGFILYTSFDALGILFRPKAYKALKKLKQEYKEGIADILFMRGPSGTETQCKIKYSLGWFNTEKCVSGRPYSFRFEGDISMSTALSSGDMMWLMRKAHNWAHNNA